MGEMDSTGDSVRVVGLCGSIRAGSFTRMALERALSGAAETGASTRLIDLRKYSLIFCDGKEDESEYPDDVFRLRKDVRDAHGIVLATPEYHGSLSGLLKNAIDLMGFDEFEGKMIGLVGVSGGPMGALNGLNSLRTVGRALHAWVIPDEAAVPNASQAFGANGHALDPGMDKRLKEVGRQVARYAYLHTSERAMEFLRLWESAPLNPGGGHARE